LLSIPTLRVTVENTSELERLLGHIFKNEELLKEALTHRSFYYENPDTLTIHNERLEFLGDSVLGFVIVEYLFLSDRNLTESAMAKIKSYLVKEAVLSEIACALSLGKYLRLGKGEESTGGRTKKSILSDTMEAVFGAIYLDGGYQEAREIILRLFGEKISKMMHSAELFDFKTELQEKTQFLFNALPEYRVIKQEGEEHKKVFTIEVYINGKRFGMGKGKSKKEAQTFAAKEALSKLAAGEN